MDLFDLYEDQKELAKEIMTSPYSLVDLSKASPEVLEHYKLFGTMARVARHIHDENFFAFFRNSYANL